MEWGALSSDKAKSNRVCEVHALWALIPGMRGGTMRTSWYIHNVYIHMCLYLHVFIKGSLGGETSVLRTFRMSGKELVKETVSQRNS